MRSIFTKISNAATLLFDYLIRSCSYVVPKDPQLCVCIGWHRTAEREVFADNAKYMFLYANTLPHTRAVWIAHDARLAEVLCAHGFEAYDQKSWYGIWIAARARVTFIDAFFKRVNWRFAGGSRVVQLWHGKGFKKSGYLGDGSLEGTNAFFAPHLHSRYDWVIASSDYTANMMTEILHTPQERILTTGLPRNDVLFKNIEGAEIDAHPELKKLFQNQKSDARHILYAPTFRRYEYDPLGPLDLDTIQSYLEAHNTYLIISLHPKHARRSTSYISRNPNIKYIDAGYDIYPYIRQFDILVSDYGSLFLEFTLLDTHTIFLTHDIEQYRATTGLYEDYEQFTPGPHVRTTDELIKAFDTCEEWKQKRAKIRALFFAYIDGNASKRIADRIIKK